MFLQSFHSYHWVINIDKLISHQLYSFSKCINMFMTERCLGTFSEVGGCTRIPRHLERWGDTRHRSSESWSRSRWSPGGVTRLTGWRWRWRWRLPGHHSSHSRSLCRECLADYPARSWYPRTCSPLYWGDCAWQETLSSGLAGTSWSATGGRCSRCSAYWLCVFCSRTSRRDRRACRRCGGVKGQDTTEDRLTCPHRHPSLPRGASNSIPWRLSTRESRIVGGHLPLVGEWSSVGSPSFTFIRMKIWVFLVQICGRDIISLNKSFQNSSNWISKPTTVTCCRLVGVCLRGHFDTTNCPQCPDVGGQFGYWWARKPLPGSLVRSHLINISSWKRNPSISSYSTFLTRTKCFSTLAVCPWIFRWNGISNRSGKKKSRRK